jgi:hypothetical protein
MELADNGFRCFHTSMFGMLVRQIAAPTGIKIHAAFSTSLHACPYCPLKLPIISISEHVLELDLVDVSEIEIIEPRVTAARKLRRIRADFPVPLNRDYFYWHCLVGLLTRIRVRHLARKEVKYVPKLTNDESVRILLPQIEYAFDELRITLHRLTPVPRHQRRHPVHSLDFLNIESKPLEPGIGKKPIELFREIQGI